MILLRLSDKLCPQSRFVVGTYHMPCAYFLPQVMLIHCALSAQHIQRFALTDPYIYTGDFNIKPGSSMYQLLTTGEIDQKHPEYPINAPGDTFELKTKLMRSAYKEANQTEPDFTNNSKVKDSPPFIDTLDYIFLSDHWSVRHVEPLPNRSEVKGPLPNQTEPSDHLLIGATVELPSLL